MKECSKCHEPKDHTEFYAGAGRCKICVRAYVKSHSKNNPDAKRRRDKLYYERVRGDIWHVAQKKVRSARSNAKRHNVPFRLTTEELISIIPEDCKCIICGEVMIFRIGEKRTNRVASIDRIIPSRGYVIDNVRWICDEDNRLKSNASFEKIKQLYDDAVRIHTLENSNRLSNEERS